MTIIEAARVPANWDGDKSIVAVAILEGKRHARYDAYIYDSGHITITSR